MKFRCMFVNPLDFKWSGTVKLSLFAKKREEEEHTAILPVLVVRDTPAVRQALDSDPLTELERATVLAALRYYQNCPEIGNAKTDIGKIATVRGKHLDADDIDELCQKINR